MARPFRTARLELIPATPELTRLAMDDEPGLARALEAAIPPTWPHDYLDRGAFEFMLERLARAPDQAGWWMYFAIHAESGSSRTLIGSAGYKGPPDAEGTVEIGYGVVSDRRRRGLASEAARGLIARAFALDAVRRVLGETLPELAGSIAVLERCGFRGIGAGSEPGVIRFELTRADYEARGAAV
jgi:RimJ/RimL family protein N-acetyltransferase